MLTISSAPSGAKTGVKFSVWVRQGAEDWQAVDVYTALAPDGTSNWIEIPKEIYNEYNAEEHGTAAKETYFCSFAFDGCVNIRIRYNASAKEFSVKPQGFVEYLQSGNEIEFSTDNPCKLSIIPDGDIFGCLHLFAESYESFDKQAYEKIIYFKKGFHTAENNPNITLNEHGEPVIDGITDNCLIYLEQGAVVCAAAELKSVKHVKIGGLGILSLLDRCYGADKDFNTPVIYGCYRYHALPSVYIHSGCDDIILQDFTCISQYRSITLRNSKHILIDNIKTFSYTVTADAVNAVNVCEMEIKNCYLQSGDDNFAVYTSYDSNPFLVDDPQNTVRPISRNISMHNCVLWTNCRPFMIGGHATGDDNPHNTLENIKIYDCEVIAVAFNIYGNSYEHNLYWSGMIRLLSQSNCLVRNICFENLRFEWTKGYTGKPVHIEIRESKSASYSETGGYRIENVIIKNVKFLNAPSERMPSLIKSIDTEDKMYGIDGVKLENLSFDDSPLGNKDLTCQGNVKNVKIV